jgi:hypothetical protein
MHAAGDARLRNRVRLDNLIHGVQRIEPKYSAACWISSSVICTAKPAMIGVFGLRESALARNPFLKSCICWTKYSFGSP